MLLALTMFTWINFNYLKFHFIKVLLFLYLICLSSGFFFSFLDSYIIKFFFFIFFIFISLNSIYEKNKLINDFLIINFFFKQNNFFIISNYLQFYFILFSDLLKQLFNLFLVFNSKKLWLPLFKKNSYILWFRTNRNIWSNTRSEENNNLKNV